MTIEIRVDTRPLEEALATLGSGAAARAVARAINRTGTSVRRSILRALSAQIGLTQRALSPRVRLGRVNQSTAARVASGREGIVGRAVAATATITASGSDITATAFNARQTRRGVSFSPGRKARRQSIAGAFLATVPGGRMGAFIRARKSRNVLVSDAEGVRRRRRVAPRGSDVPIAKLLLPGISSTLLDDDTQFAIQQEGEETLARRLSESVEIELIRAIQRSRRTGR